MIKLLFDSGIPCFLPTMTQLINGFCNGIREIAHFGDMTRLLLWGSLNGSLFTNEETAYSSCSRVYIFWSRIS